ncbi:uncharacterized protein A4U43_C09F11670 [Asparagus officinalis]|uniref:Uncharacterized protein n=1 Tax=Asparagus officinalis TaxID=4686 RepID=A0A5P1E6Y7_ASPOF|nr:poly(A)-specific ribonuclease PARN-like [Asparagus officinalis]ONK58381.1 uncharacterized protein A4U43_C09F11670 [Asparagus officinalis]
MEATIAAAQRQGYTSAVKQVMKTNFTSALEEIKAHINQSDFIAVSSQKTGDFFSSSSSWRRVLPIDTPEVAYLKSKVSADNFQLFQFAVCPFSIQGSKVLASPYNFHLFPRDELGLGMPSYSFSCQTSFLTSMAQEGFDFNACIYDGISYLSRVQESKAKERNPVPRMHPISSSFNPSVADSLFMGRIKSRIEHWRSACKNKDSVADGSLVKSLRKLILGDELYGSRPCMNIEVCSDRQVQLTLEIVNKIGDDLVPLVVPEKCGAPKAVRVVLTSSDEDKILLMSDIENVEDEQNLKVRGFREVIDLVSRSQKPIIAYNCLHDFTFIHSKFLAPLPPSLSEFMCSLRLVFPNILDVNHLCKEVGPLRKAKNLPATLSYLKRQFFVPIEFEIPHQADVKTEKDHGHNVLRITTLFSKLYNLLKLSSERQEPYEEQHRSIEDYTNIFHPTYTSFQESGDNENVILSMNKNRRKVSTDNIVFLWGFGDRISASELKSHLKGIHPVFSEDFDLRLVDKACSVIVFWSSGAAQALLKVMESGEMISIDLKLAGYEAYKKVCKSGLWEAGLANSLEAALAETELECDLSASSAKDSSDIYWNSELMIDLDNL